MKIFAIIGSTTEVVDQTSSPVCPSGHIEMTGRRPDEDHVAQADGTWAVTDGAIDRARAARLAQINTACDALLDSYGDAYPAAEVRTFSQQAAEAQAYKQDNETPAPLLRSLAGARGIDPGELAEKILARHARFSAICAEVIAQRQVLKDRLELCQTIDEIRAMDVSVALTADLENEGDSSSDPADSSTAELAMKLAEIQAAIDQLAGVLRSTGKNAPPLQNMAPASQPGTPADSR